MGNLDKENGGLENEKAGKEYTDPFERTAQYDPLEKKSNEENELYSSLRAPDEIKIQAPILKKLENFFYHYKWHTLIAAFIVFVISLCVFQTCKKTSYDAYVLYAGGKNLRSVEENETESVFVNLYKAAGVYVGDYNGDDERNLSLIDIYLPSDEEIKELEAEGNVPYNLLQDNDELFRNNMLAGDYYVCMISKHLLDEWSKDTNPFVPIASYLPENADIAADENDTGYRFASDYGIYLNSTPLRDKPGFKYLPEDTVICFRKYSAAAAPGKRGKTIYQNSEKFLRALLKGETYE